MESADQGKEVGGMKVILLKFNFQPLSFGSEEMAEHNLMELSYWAPDLSRNHSRKGCNGIQFLPCIISQMKQPWKGWVFMKVLLVDHLAGARSKAHTGKVCHIIPVSDSRERSSLTSLRTVLLIFICCTTGCYVSEYNRYRQFLK